MYGISICENPHVAAWGFLFDVLLYLGMTLGDLYDIIVSEKPDGMSIDEWFSMPVMVGANKETLRELEWDGVGMVDADVNVSGQEGIMPDVPMLVFAISVANDLVDDSEEEYFDPQLN